MQVLALRLRAFLVDKRHDRASLLITSQLPVASWRDVMGDPTLDDAILDRVLHTAIKSS